MQLFMPRRSTPHADPVSLHRGWRILVEDLGLEMSKVLQRAELAAELFDEPSPQISVDEYFRLWNALELEAGHETLPLHLGSLVSTETFHWLIFAALCSPNLMVATNRIAQYKRLIAPIAIHVEHGPGGMFVGMEWSETTLEVPPSLAVTELVLLTRVARLGTRQEIRPLKVVSRTPLSPLSQYEAFFGVRPQQGDRHGIVFGSEDAIRPFLTVSESLWTAFEPRLNHSLLELDTAATTAQRLRSTLLIALPAGQSSIADVAPRLGLSVRTLQRKLKGELTSYKNILRETRKSLAHHYVAQTNLSYPEIAFLLGFAGSSSFFRAFREWTGTTPESVRRANTKAEILQP